MEQRNFIQSSTDTIPTIEYYPEQGNLSIIGVSIADNIGVIYNELITMLEEHLEKAQVHTKLVIHLEYFNTKTASALCNIFTLMQLLHRSQASQVNVTWLADKDDSDLIEAGMEFQSIFTDLPFEIKDTESMLMA